MFQSRRFSPAAATVVLALACGTSLRADGIIDSIVPAPISPDGTVAGATTDFVINLDRSFDPAVEGRTLLGGNTIRVILPSDFVDDQTLPIGTVFSSPDCTIGNFQCNTSILVQGWPQRPVRPVSPVDGSAVYSFSREGTHAFIHTADVDVVPGTPPPGPGIKQVHLILPGFTNPAPGLYEVQIIAQTGPNGEEETGSGMVEILPEIQPSINVTSIYNPGNPNTIYQTVRQGELAPLPYDFFVWDGDGNAFTGLTIDGTDIQQGGATVGQVTIDAPLGASGQEVITTAPSVPANEPFFGKETGRLTAMFRAGNRNGQYVTTLALNGGNSVQLFSTVIPEPSAWVLLTIGMGAFVVASGRRSVRR